MLFRHFPARLPELSVCTGVLSIYLGNNNICLQSVYISVRLSMCVYMCVHPFIVYLAMEAVCLRIFAKFQQVLGC